jgi:hypothetical protein
MTTKKPKIVKELEEIADELEVVRDVSEDEPHQEMAFNGMFYDLILSLASNHTVIDTSKSVKENVNTTFAIAKALIERWKEENDYI